MSRFATTTAILSVLAAPAFAGALIVEPVPEEPVTVIEAAPPPPLLPTWTGPYAGAQVGWGRLEADVDVDDATVSLRDDDVIGGFHAGYDWQFDNGFVLGGEFAYDRANTSDFREGVTVELDNVVRLTARGGFGFGDTLVYARGGAAWLDGDVTIGGDTSSASDWGWVAGAGVEQRFTPNMSAGLEGLYHEVSDFGGADANLWTVQARLSWRF